MANKILRSMVGVGNQVLTIDTVEHEGQLWLVPHWLVPPDGKTMTPLRMISLATIPHQLTPGGDFGDVVVNSPIPKSVLDQGFVPKDATAQYVILESPDIVFPNPDGR